MRRPIVWVVKEQVRRDSTGPVPMDYTPAAIYGDLRFITTFDIPLHAPSTLLTAWVDEVKAFHKEFDPNTDWLVLTGSPLSIFMIGLIIGHMEVEPRILVWRRERGEYVPFESKDLI